MQADAMLERAGLDGYAVWKRVLRAVEELQRAEPGAGVQVHCVAVHRNHQVVMLADAIVPHRKTCRN